MNIKLRLKLNAYTKVDLTNVLSAEYLQGVLKSYYTAEQIDYRLGAIESIDADKVNQAIKDSNTALETANKALETASNISTNNDSINALLTEGRVVLDEKTGEEGFLVNKKEKSLLEDFLSDTNKVLLDCGTATTDSSNINN